MLLGRCWLLTLLADGDAQAALLPPSTSSEAWQPLAPFSLRCSFSAGHAPLLLT
jgi:hypothetical protein